LILIQYIELHCILFLFVSLENISSPLTHTMQQLQQHNRKKTRVADKVKACKKTSNLGGNAFVDEAEMVLQPQRLTMALRNVSNTAQLLLACHTPHFLGTLLPIS